MGGRHAAILCSSGCRQLQHPCLAAVHALLGSVHMHAASSSSPLAHPLALPQVLSQLPLPTSIAGRITSGSLDGKQLVYCNGATQTQRWEYKARPPAQHCHVPAKLLADC